MRPIVIYCLASERPPIDSTGLKNAHVDISDSLNYLAISHKTPYPVPPSPEREGNNDVTSVLSNLKNVRS
jgi:hypothetical protein